MKAAVLILAAAFAAASAPAMAWPGPAGDPAQAAAQQRAERERLRALADQREALARADQLRTEATRHRLEQGLAPAATRPPGPVFTPEPLRGLVQREEALAAAAGFRADAARSAAARAGAERERLRARADHREAIARADQLRSEAIAHRLERDRRQTWTPPPGPALTESGALPADDSAARREDTERRLGAMDAWLAGPGG